MMSDNINTTDLTRIHKGMTVYDLRGDAIGTVESVFLGEVSDDAIEQGGNAAVSPDIDLSGNDSLVDNIADVFAPDDLPRELAERLLNSGYVRLDTNGLLSPDRYIMPEQISSVTGDSVRLRVSVDDLTKR